MLAAPMSLWASEAQAPVRQAEGLRDKGQFTQAIEVLDRYLQQNPDDAEAARLRAETLVLDERL